MTDMQKRLLDLQRDVNQLKNEKFRPRKFDNIPRFNYRRGQVYGQNYGRGQGYCISLYWLLVICIIHFLMTFL
jgi:hypothetical protein